MKAMVPDRVAVEFYATSPRLAHAYRRAAKHNRCLSQCAKIQKLGNGGILHPSPNLARGVEMVVLSHADDHFVQSTARTKSAFSEAFHLLFTEPTTHPDQIVRWMRTANVRSENRLHVIAVEDLEAPEVSQLLGRICVALGRDGGCGSIIDAYVIGGCLNVRGPKLRVLRVPLNAVRELKDQPTAAIRNFTIDPDGSFIYWPDLDVHLGWNQFLQAVDPHELRKAEQRSAAFNGRYGAAIRKLRQAGGVLQSKVDGLTERQIRRIEQGECRATTAALGALAKAHGLDVHGYMEELAKAITLSPKATGSTILGS